MKHRMKLKDGPFKSIESGSKVVELRLYDEKRSKIKVGDVIEFTNIMDGDILEVDVVSLHRYNSFEELYKDFDKVSLGYREDEDASYRDMEEYYSKEEQAIYGVVGIEISLRVKEKKI